jgi:uncharacterized protein YecE (DUF72 family)
LISGTRVFVCAGDSGNIRARMATRESNAQLSLFAGAPAPAKPRGAGKSIEPAPLDENLVSTAAALPAAVRLGTSSWSFPGWTGIVYAGSHSENLLARNGLAAYAHHPLLRCVGIDRTYYRPVDAETFTAYRAEVPDGFRFVVKAHEDLTLPRFPSHPRYGARSGRENPRYLDAAHARDAVVAPAVEGLGEALGPIVFQFSPEHPRGAEDARRFAERLESFLAALPRGPLYAVELRTRAFLTPRYADALACTGAVHCLNVHPSMPPLAEQWARVAIEDGRAVVVRWMLGAGMKYEDARDRYAPFNRLVDEDPETRGEIAELSVRAAMREIPVYVVANNKAEGSAPLSLFALAREMARRRGRRSEAPPR